MTAERSTLFDIRDVYAIEAALDELCSLALAYERRLVFKGRYTAKARSAARAIGRADTVVRRMKDTLRERGAA